VWEAIEKEAIPEDPSKRTDKGKSLHAFSAENLVISHGIADRSAITIKVPHVTTQDQQVPLEISLTFDKHNKKKALSE
jgi:hypothetical protein